jgi:hypothetical protein
MIIFFPGRRNVIRVVVIADIPDEKQLPISMFSRRAIL